MASTAESISASVLAFARAFGLSRSLVIFDFDAHATLEELPENDLIGIMEFSLGSDTGMLTTETMIVISTNDDLNLGRLRKFIGELFDQLQPGATFSVVDADSGIAIGNLKIMDGTQILPVARSRTRPFQAIAIRAGSDIRLRP